MANRDQNSKHGDWVNTLRKRKSASYFDCDVRLISLTGVKSPAWRALASYQILQVRLWQYWVRSTNSCVEHVKVNAVTTTVGRKNWPLPRSPTAVIITTITDNFGFYALFLISISTYSLALLWIFVVFNKYEEPISIHQRQKLFLKLWAPSMNSVLFPLCSNSICFAKFQFVTTATRTCNDINDFEFIMISIKVGLDDLEITMIPSQKWNIVYWLLKSRNAFIDQENEWMV